MDTWIITKDDKEYRFVTNAPKTNKDHFKLASKAAKVPVIFEDAAYDCWDRLLPDSMAVYVPIEYTGEGNNSIDKLFFAISEVRRQYKEILLKNGCDKEIVDKIYTYLGCEKEYFPDMIGKIIIE